MIDRFGSIHHEGYVPSVVDFIIAGRGRNRIVPVSDRAPSRVSTSLTSCPFNNFFRHKQLLDVCARQHKQGKYHISQNRRDMSITGISTRASCSRSYKCLQSSPIFTLSAFHAGSVRQFSRSSRHWNQDDKVVAPTLKKFNANIPRTIYQGPLTNTFKYLK